MRPPKDVSTLVKIVNRSPVLTPAQAQGKFYLLQTYRVSHIESMNLQGVSYWNVWKKVLNTQWFKLREMRRKLFGTLDRFKLWLFECFQWILALKGFKNWIKAKEGQKAQWRPTKAIEGQNFKTILYHH